MNFATNPNALNQNFSAPKKQTWWQKFISQPHQLFFTSAVFFAILVMLLTFISLLGKASLNFALIHGFALNYAVFTNAFLGFLLTVMPKYNASKVIDKKIYLNAWIVFELALLLSLISDFLLAKLFVSFTMFYFAYIFYKTIKSGKVGDKKDSIYINLVFIFGAVFLLIESLFSLNLSILIFFAYLLPLVFLVAQRMVPAFYSSYMQIKPWQKPKYLRQMVVLILFLLAISLQFEYIFLAKITAGIAMLFFSYIVFNLNIYKKTPAILFILVLAFIWLDLAFIVLFLEVIFETYSLKMSLHIFAIGFILNLLIGFGSRVIMAHGIPPQRPNADKLTLIVFVLTNLVLLTRIIASLLFLQDSAIFMGFLHLSASLWILVFILWSFRYIKTLLCLNS